MAERADDRAYAAVRFMGPTLDPLHLTLALGLPPTHQHRDGEPRLVRSASGQVKRSADHRGGMWSMSSRSWVRSSHLEPHLDWLLSQLEPHGETIRDLLGRGVDADFFCFLSGRAEHPPPVATVIIDRAEALGIPIEIDYYQECDGDDP